MPQKRKAHVLSVCRLLGLHLVCPHSAGSDATQLAKCHANNGEAKENTQKWKPVPQPPVGESFPIEMVMAIPMILANAPTTVASSSN
uniref:HDC12480 n=1 Tax=Drosophila melanogaster TaxID=7227 RepID=Q6IKH2_DROME|nr:TPA_inf: HDC12480 [Drosophila melanogaster]